MIFRRIARILYRFAMHFDNRKAESILGLLYWHYTECNPIDNQKIREGFAQIRQQYPHLSMQEFDPIFTTVSDLCVEHERLALLEGLRLSVTLMMELVNNQSG